MNGKDADDIDAADDDDENDGEAIKEPTEDCCMETALYATLLSAKPFPFTGRFSS